MLQRRNTICPQLNFGLDNDGLLAGSTEDCLYLNVYVPVTSHSRPLPVAVWLHGGAFMFGSGAACWFGPHFWMVHEIILVTINYRLGPLGFLTTDDKTAAGNQGLRDQVMVLNWVKANIGKFGGDPDKVTIFGEDSGAASVTLMAMSPLAKGLFHRAIALSGEKRNSILDAKNVEYLKTFRESL